MTKPRFRKAKPWRLERVIKAALTGAHRGLAAQYAGFTEATLERYYKASTEWVEGDPPELQHFAKRLDEAEAMAAVGCLSDIQLAARAGKWQAAAWLLERKYPEQYGKARAAAVTVNVGGDASVAVIASLADQFDDLPAEVLDVIEAHSAARADEPPQLPADVIDVTPELDE